MNRLRTLDEAAAELHKSKRWLQDWLAKNPMDAVGRPFSSKLGRTRLFQDSDLSRILEATRDTPCPSKSSRRAPAKRRTIQSGGKYLGIAVDRSARTSKKSVADRELKKLEAAIERGEYPEKPKQRSATFLSAAVAYMKAGRSRRYVGKLIQHFGETPLPEVDQATIDAAALAIYPNVSAGYAKPGGLYAGWRSPAPRRN